MIQYKDFVPNIKKKFLLPNNMESLSSTLERVNTWVRQNEQFEIINLFSFIKNLIY